VFVRQALLVLGSLLLAAFFAVPLAAPASAECTPAKYGTPGCPYPSLGTNDTYRPNTDRPGSDYTSFDINGQPVDCQNACSKDARCRAWTWVKPGVQGPKARCWLKGAEPAEVANNCCFSGRNPNPIQKPIKTTGKAKPAGSGGLSADAQALLNAHNAYRAKHCVGQLSWSATLAAQAQAWASKCTRNGNVFAHSGFNGYGENLAWGGGLGAKAAVDLWYAEVSKYNFGSPAWSNAVGHFTQVVWRATTQVGCGVATCNGQQLWVCQYTPPGNWNVNNPGVMASNVPAACR
jgi:uncharacterized protein YkwD